MMIGRLNFQFRLYVQAEIDLEKAWDFLLVGKADHPDNITSDIRADEDTECFGDDEEWTSSETLLCEMHQTSVQLLYLMGIVSIRLHKYKRAISCISVALKISSICSSNIFSVFPNF